MWGWTIWTWHCIREQSINNKNIGNSSKETWKVNKLLLLLLLVFLIDSFILHTCNYKECMYMYMYSCTLYVSCTCTCISVCVSVCVPYMYMPICNVICNVILFLLLCLLECLLRKLVVSFWLMHWVGSLRLSIVNQYTGTTATCTCTLYMYIIMTTTSTVHYCIFIIQQLHVQYMYVHTVHLLYNYHLIIYTTVIEYMEKRQLI